MSTTGRILRWILPGILCWGGCATHPLVEPTPTPTVTSHDSASREPGAAPRVEPNGAARDSAVGHLAELSPVSAPGVDQVAETVPSAYAELCREAAPNSADSASPPTTEEGVPLSPVQTAASTPSPAAAEASGPSRPVSPPTIADVRAARAATSVFAPSPDTPTTVPPSATVTMAARRSESAADVAAPPPAGHRPVEDAGSRAADAAMAIHSAAALPSTAESSATSVAEPSAKEPPALSWRQQVKLAVDQLRQELGNGTMDDEQRIRCQVYLSLMLLAEEDPEKAIAALEDFDDEQLEFWRQTVLGMSVLLNSDELPKLRHRIDSATEHFYRGVSSLSVLGPLRLLNLAFCTKVNGYGDYVECSDYGLEAGKPVLLYVEVENYTVEPIDSTTTQNGWSQDTTRRNKGVARSTPKYATELHGRYEILDAEQRAVVSRTLPIGRDECRNRRRDYYISYVVYMPEQIPSGAYTLELTIEDKKGAKYGNAVIDFRVK
ncbi:MAG: hypothetical protein ACYC0X_04555 [Pirellulaceae bacterium]